MNSFLMSQKKFLSKLVRLLKSTTPHNFTVLFFALVGCHFRLVINHFRGFSMVIAYGPTDTGKYTSLKIALALLPAGCILFQRIHRYYDGTFSTFMLPICNRRLKYGVLYSCWDQCALHCSSEFHVYILWCNAQRSHRCIWQSKFSYLMT